MPAGRGVRYKKAMENAAKQDAVPLGWKLAIVLPLAAALSLMLLATRQHELHRQIAFSTAGTIMVMVANIVVSIYWIVVKKLVGWGIALLIVGSAVAGFGLHTLLRVI